MREKGIGLVFDTQTPHTHTHTHTHMLPVFPAPFVEGVIFYIVYVSVFFVKSQVVAFVWVYFWDF
jgi:hypothetical protein